MSTVVMQSLAYVQHSSPVPGAKLFISGDLRLQQRMPLPHRGLYNIYNVRGYTLIIFLSTRPLSLVFSFSCLNQSKLHHRQMIWKSILLTYTQILQVTWQSTHQEGETGVKVDASGTENYWKFMNGRNCDSEPATQAVIGGMRLVPLFSPVSTHIHIPALKTCGLLHVLKVNTTWV